MMNKNKVRGQVARMENDLDDRQKGRECRC